MVALSHRSFVQYFKNVALRPAARESPSALTLFYCLCMVQVELRTPGMNGNTLECAQVSILSVESSGYATTG